MIEAFLERAVGGLAGHVQDLAVHVVVPGVVAAAYAPLLDLPELQRRAPVRAVELQEPYLSRAVLEDHQVLAQDTDGRG